ncbi:MAG: radical SAM protein [Candidatus Cloacimonadaceae bacterium]|jgi:wyosine [tRNA(Phe)-imidazoG37] synthetase (radical SAM superfamily)|nr:radical SAM protein [Candidatus Cloacimonadota bacterium]MDY0127906.1 radical SAM protein [Candidatus Cloacimonadaceae bacterium]MCB5255791.1 radical SAM protein [Candidatus Cloacimonadota bacterium]MCK9178312.1 radical SAM protein [Candidatus Cloacimonadota bacterium]MCK9242944.1 radical SAM protein [Candidatus Cloacimonadota bacterium]
MKYKHLFGPVASRRLGISLGVDLVPYKYCPLNCVYCEVQSTTHLQTKREAFYPVTEILAELDDFMLDRPHLDYITFSGAGEPTLNSSIKEIILYIKSHYPEYKLALLTNGVLLSNDEVLEEIMHCDVILPSLDAASQKVYEKVNRPQSGLSVSDQIAGLIKLRRLYAGQIWLEVFIVPDITDTPQELSLLRDAIQEISPDLVQLNSLDRPGAEEWVKAASTQRLKEIKSFMSEELRMPIEIIAKIVTPPEAQAPDEEIVNLIRGSLSRRDSTAEDLAFMLDIHINEISKILRVLSAEDKLQATRKARGVCYSWKS